MQNSNFLSDEDDKDDDTNISLHLLLEYIFEVFLGDGAIICTVGNVEWSPVCGISYVQF